jgi:DnaJ-class molecular chaperone
MAQPYRCPVCFGSGLVDEALYTGRATHTTTMVLKVLCRSCAGTGIVWGP